MITKEPCYRLLVLYWLPVTFLYSLPYTIPAMMPCGNFIELDYMF